mgnify:CR=1 FL=1
MHMPFLRALSLSLSLSSCRNIGNTEKLETLRRNLRFEPPPADLDPFDTRKRFPEVEVLAIDDQF